MPNPIFWNWQSSSLLCKQCGKFTSLSRRDCMRCEIVWDAATDHTAAAFRKLIETAQQPTTPPARNAAYPGTGPVVIGGTAGVA